MSTPELGIGMVGYGGMGKAHSLAYALAPRVRDLPVLPRLRVISGRDAGDVQRAARSYGFERFTTDWREVVQAPDVGIVDICTPPGAHAEVVEAAAQAGKAILCEKPLAAGLADGTRAVEAVQRAGVRNAIGFNYRHLPALALMKQLIDDGRVGTPRLWRGSFLTDEFADPELPFDWRFDRALGASTIADLGSHMIDLARWMVGDIEAACGHSETFVRARHHDRGRREVDVDDASSALLRFSSGAIGVFEAAKVCQRRPCDLTVEVNGTRGTVRFEYARLNELWFGDATEDPELYGMRRIRAEHQAHPETEGWWPLGQGIGYGESFVNQAADLLSRWPDGRWSPDLAAGLSVQVVCETIERAAAERRWVDVAEVMNHAAV